MRYIRYEKEAGAGGKLRLGWSDCEWAPRWMWKWYDEFGERDATNDKRRTTSCSIINIKSRHCLQCVGTGTNAHQRVRGQRRRESGGGKGACGLRKSHNQLTLRISKQNERWKDAKMHCKCSAIYLLYVLRIYSWWSRKRESAACSNYTEGKLHDLWPNSKTLYGQVPNPLLSIVNHNPMLFPKFM